MTVYSCDSLLGNGYGALNSTIQISKSNQLRRKLHAVLKLHFRQHAEPPLGYCKCSSCDHQLHSLSILLLPFFPGKITPPWASGALLTWLLTYATEASLLARTTSISSYCICCLLAFFCSLRLDHHMGLSLLVVVGLAYAFVLELLTR